MFQQAIALIIIVIFIYRLFKQKNKDSITTAEFIFWLAFWLLAAIMIIFIKYVDRLVKDIGFSASGIQILFYIAVAILFYLYLRLRLKLEKMEKNITRIVRAIAINQIDDEEKSNTKK